METQAALKRHGMREEVGISVIVPVYNGEQYLSQAIGSILQQTYEGPLEILVVDDGSTDTTAAIAAQWQNVGYLYQRNQGNAVAKNMGIAHTTQPLVAFLDVDDLWATHKLEAQVAHLNANPQLGYVLCCCQVILEADRWPAHLNQTYWQSNPPLYAPSALLARRSVLDQVGSFSVDYRRANDSDWFLRARSANIEMAVTPEVLVYKRIHTGNISHEVAPMTQELMQSLRQMVRRQRKP